MALTDNNGTFYYAISCGVPSTSGVKLTANNFTGYYYMSANDYILYGQSTKYAPITSNNGTALYLFQCNVPSVTGFNFQSNNGTGYYYSSAFNCVSFCS